MVFKILKTFSLLSSVFLFPGSLFSSTPVNNMPSDTAIAASTGVNNYGSPKGVADDTIRIGYAINVTADGRVTVSRDNMFMVLNPIDNSIEIEKGGFGYKLNGKLQYTQGVEAIAIPNMEFTYLPAYRKAYTGIIDPNGPGIENTGRIDEPVPQIDMIGVTANQNTVTSTKSTVTKGYNWNNAWFNYRVKGIEEKGIE